MATSPQRSQDLLLALAALALAGCGAALGLLAPDSLPDGSAGRVWLRATAIAAAVAAGLVAAGLLYGRLGSPGRQLGAAGTALGLLALLTAVLGGIYLVVDDRVAADVAAGLGAMVALPAVGALWLASGRLLRPR